MTSDVRDPTAPGLYFRRLEAVEEDAGYAVLVDTVAWLKEQGIQLWENPLPRQVYARRHTEGWNYALFQQGHIAVVMSLVPEIPSSWRDRVADPQAMWLCTLATARSCRGQGLGACAVEHACRHLAATGRSEVFLDCKPGFLEGYYQHLGFTILERDLVPVRGPFTAVLMRRNLP